MTTLSREETSAPIPAPGELLLGCLEDAPPLHCGYGACAKCNCRQFEGNQGTCANQGCGHAYQDHW